MLGTIVKESVSQKRITVFLLALFVVLLCHAVLLPARDNPMGIKDKQDITLSAPTLVGGTVLPAGDYKVTLSCLSWKWRKRSSVKIAERTYEKGTKALHRRGEGGHSEAPPFGQGSGFGPV